MCYIQLPSGLTKFRSISVKPYFRPKDTYNVKLDKLEVTAKLDKLEAAAKLDKLEATAELDKLEAPLPTLEVP